MLRSLSLTCERSRRATRLTFSVCFLALLANAGWAGDGAETEVDLSPARWGAAAISEAAKRDAASWDQPPALARGRQGVVATTSMGGTAARAGLEALRQGGSAVDAALVTALTQTVLNAGCWTSFAGLMSMVVYDAESGEVFTLEGGWNTVRGETYPLPPEARSERPGRAVLVPGFMAAVQAAHDRFGVLPFDELFAPAIYFAEEGFELGAHLGFLIDYKKDVLTRFPSGREIFLRPDGKLYARGDVFRQPQLAAFLRAVAAGGDDVMYRSPWAEKLVAAAVATGGKIRLEDLRAYRATWRPPARGRFHGHEIAGLGLPSAGGLEMIESFRLVERLGLDPTKHYSEDPEALYRLIQIPRLFHLFAAGPSGKLATRLFGPLDLSPWGRWNEATTRAIGDRMEAADWQQALRAALAGPTEAVVEEHSDGVVVADARGNVVALFHSINTGAWGSGGLFVDGVSISDAGHYPRNARAGSGHRISHAGRPFLVLKDGQPVVASSSVGQALHSKAMQNVLNMVVYGMNPQASLRAPQFFGPDYSLEDGRPAVYRQKVPAGAFSDEVLERLRELGQEVVLRPPNERVGVGLWSGLRVDGSGLAEASATPGGHAEGY